MDKTDIASIPVEIAPGVFWVGVLDRERTIFDSFMSLPYGTTYNAYLVVGSYLLMTYRAVNEFQHITSFVLCK